jgi:hypothetical protein
VDGFSVDIFAPGSEGPNDAATQTQWETWLGVMGAALAGESSVSSVTIYRLDESFATLYSS